MDRIPDIIADPGEFSADAAFWLRAASTAVREHCGWHITPSLTLEGALNSRGGIVLRLPALHVTEIELLTTRDGTPIPHAYDPESGLVEALNRPFPVGVGAVRYRITAGWDERPDVQGVVINAAKRASMAANGMVTAQSVNGSSVSYDVDLMQSELDKLKPYRLIGLP